MPLRLARDWLAVLAHAQEVEVDGVAAQPPGAGRTRPRTVLVGFRRVGMLVAGSGPVGGVAGRAGGARVVRGWCAGRIGEGRSGGGSWECGQAGEDFG
jgi:hypothetical protein